MYHVDRRSLVQYSLCRYIGRFPLFLLYDSKKTKTSAQCPSEHQPISRARPEPQPLEGKSGKLPQALKDAVMAPDIASNIHRVIARVLPRSRTSCRQHDASNFVSPTTGVTRSHKPRFAANGIIQGDDLHAGTLRSTPLNRDLVLSSASLPGPGALVLRAAVYRKQDAIATVRHPCLLLVTMRGYRCDASNASGR